MEESRHHASSLWRRADIKNPHCEGEQTSNILIMKESRNQTSWLEDVGNLPTVLTPLPCKIHPFARPLSLEFMDTKSDADQHKNLGLPRVRRAKYFVSVSSGVTSVCIRKALILQLTFQQPHDGKHESCVKVLSHIFAEV